MNFVDNRTTRKDNNKYQTTNINNKHQTTNNKQRPKLGVFNGKNYNEVKKASDKTLTEQFNIYFIRKHMGPVLNATG